jgi:hypothetical protein
MLLKLRSEVLFHFHYEKTESEEALTLSVDML